MASCARLDDASVAKQADFACSILSRLRDMVHRACPRVTETIKWGMPAFEYHGLLCSFAAFNAHATFGFWKHDEVIGPTGEGSRDAMGSFGRLTRVRDVPKVSQFNVWMCTAMARNKSRISKPRRSTAKAATASPPARKARATHHHGSSGTQGRPRQEQHCTQRLQGPRP
jgi:hypothetical protein